MKIPYHLSHKKRNESKELKALSKKTKVPHEVQEKYNYIRETYRRTELPNSRDLP